MYETEYLDLLQKLYEWSIVGPDDIDDPRYTISKKLSEVRPTANGDVLIVLTDVR